MWWYYNGRTNSLKKSYNRKHSCGGIIMAEILWKKVTIVQLIREHTNYILGILELEWFPNSRSDLIWDKLMMTHVSNTRPREDALAWAPRKRRLNLGTQSISYNQSHTIKSSDNYFGLSSRSVHVNTVLLTTSPPFYRPRGPCCRPHGQVRLCGFRLPPDG